MPKEVNSELLMPIGMRSSDVILLLSEKALISFNNGKVYKDLFGL